MHTAFLKSDAQSVCSALKKAVFKLGYSSYSFEKDSCYFETPNTMKQGLAVSILIEEKGELGTELTFSIDYKKTMGLKPIVAVTEKQKKTVQQNVLAVVSSILLESIEEKQTSKAEAPVNPKSDAKQKSESIVNVILQEQAKSKSNSSTLIVLTVLVLFFTIFFLPKMISNSKSYDSINAISEKIIMKSKQDVVKILGTPDSDRGEILVYFRMFHNKASNTYCDVYIYLTSTNGVYDVRYGGCMK